MKRLLRPLLLVVLVSGVIWTNRHLDLTWSGAVATARGMLEPLGAWAPLAFIGFCILALIAHVPGLAVIAFGAVLFGKLGGFLYGWLGSLAGVTATFVLARYLFRDAVQHSLVERFGALRRLDERLVSHGIRTIMVLRLLFFLAPPMNWAVGASRVRLRHYVAGSALGIMPGIAVTVYFAGVITTVDSWQDLVSSEVLLSAASIAGLLVASWFATRWVLARSETSEGDK